MKNFFKSLDYGACAFFLGILFIIALVALFVVSYQSGNNQLYGISCIAMFGSIPVLLIAFTLEDIANRF